MCPTWCPEARRKAPMEAARPTQTVDTFGRMCRIVSKTAIPASFSLLSRILPRVQVPSNVQCQHAMSNLATKMHRTKQQWGTG